MLQSIERYIRENNLLNTEATVIVGFSGGADSLVLLHALQQLAYRCIAAHCNFHLRGEESMRDEQFAETFCLRQNIPFHKIDFDTEGYAASHKLSIEMAARELRYDWFETLRLRYHAEAVAVAHHQDDSVETILINLIRGTGIKGLVGIKPQSDKVIRPLLHLTKSDLLAYIDCYQLAYVTDSTNLQDVYVRNKIRLQVLPLLEEINPSVSEAIARTASNLLQVEEVYHSAIAKKKEDILVYQDDHLYIPIQEVVQFASPEALLYEILSDFRFNRAQVQDIRSAFNAQPGKVFHSPTHRLIKDRDFLIVLPAQTIDQEEYKISSGMHFIQTPIPLQIKEEEYNPEFSFEKDSRLAYFDKDKLRFPLILRKWQEKDFFVPYGMTGKQKISKYFKDHKFSRVQKEESWLLCSGESVIWIVGERADNRFKVDQYTTKIYSLRLLFADKLGD